MTETKPEGELMRAVHIMNGVSQSLSTDGEAAMLVFDIASTAVAADGAEAHTGKTERFAITLPTAALKVLRGMVSDALTMAEQRNVGTGNMTLRPVEAVSVANVGNIRNHVGLILNPGKETEVAYLIDDRLALQVADGITQNVMSRMSPEDRRAMMRGAAPLILQSAPKLIVPGGN